MTTESNGSYESMPSVRHRKLATTRALQHFYFDVCFGEMDLNELAAKYEQGRHDDDETIVSGFHDDTATTTAAAADSQRSGRASMQ
eukprot:jgi/Hompol1/3241/HPOL_002471-RA